MPALELGREAFEKLAYGDRLDGVVAVAETPPRSLEALGPAARAADRVVEGVEKPGNLGAVLRTADGAGVNAVIVAESATDLFNPNIIRASVGTVFAVPVAVASSGDVLDWLTGTRHRDHRRARATARSTTRPPTTAAQSLSRWAARRAGYRTPGASWRARQCACRCSASPIR